MLDYSEGASQKTTTPAAACALAVFVFPTAAGSEREESCPPTKLHVDVTHAICCRCLFPSLPHVPVLCDYQ